MKNKIFLLIITIISSNISAQNFFTNETYIQSTFNKGLMLPEYKFISFYTKKSLTAFEISVFKKTAGKNIWHKIYKYPEIGFRYYFTTLGNDDIYGNVNALFSFVNFNIGESKNVSLNFSPGLGLCYAQKVFDIHTNYTNIAIASHLNIFFNFDLNFRYKILKNIYLTSNINFKHISNASLKQPNVGLNFINAGIGTVMMLGQKSEINEITIPEFIKKGETSFIYSAGLKSASIYDGYDYFISSFSVNYKRYLVYKYALGIGADLFFDSSLKNAIEQNGNIEFRNRYFLTSGFHVSNEVVVNKLIIGFQVGYFVFLKDMYKNQKMYNRLTVKYKLTKSLIFNLSLKTHIVIADYLEWGLGYYF